MVKVEVNKETAWQNRLFLVGKIANPALSFVRLLASAICNQGPAEGPKMWLGFVLIVWQYELWSFQVGVQN